MSIIANAILWPGEAISSIIGFHEENDSKHLLRLFINLAIWSKVGAIIAIYAVDWGA